MRRARLCHGLADLDGWALLDTGTPGGLVRFHQDIDRLRTWVDLVDLTFLDHPDDEASSGSTGDAGSPWKAARVTGTTTTQGRAGHVQHDAATS